MAMSLSDRETEKKITQLEKKISENYSEAIKSVEQKLQKHLQTFQKADADMLKKLKDGTITKDKYLKFRQDRMLTGRRWEIMKQTLSSDLANAHKIATDLIRDAMPDVYALNANYAMYEIESKLKIGTSFALYNHRAVENLMTGKYPVMATPSPDIPKQKHWDRQRIVSQITQGILAGEPIPDIAKRLRNVAEMDEKAAVRNARTWMTAAQNAGRYDSFQYAEEQGIELEKTWVATLDSRTRESHRLLDGETVPLNETFGNGLMFPGDPDGDESEYINCRCTMVSSVKNRVYHDERFSRLPSNISYEDWKAGKKWKE